MGERYSYTSSWQEVLNVYLISKSLRKQSIYNYVRYIKYFSNFFGNTFTNINTIDSEIVSTFRKYILYSRKCKNVTWNSYCRHFKALMTFAIENNLVAQKKNPFEHMLIKPGRKEKKTISQNDIDFCIDYLTNKSINEKKMIFTTHVSFG